MGLFRKSNGGFMDQIRCDESSYLIWKWHPSGSQLGNNRRENAIRWGSALRVKDGEVAVFVYNQKNGTYQDFIEGPFDKPIKTENFPVLARLVGFAYAGGTPFQAEVYFINLAQIIQTRFAVPFFDVYDPRFLDFAVPVAVRGTVSFQIKDYREFIKLHRLINFSLDDFGVPVAVRGTISFQIKDYREFIKLHRLINFNLDDFQKQIRDVVCRYAKDTVANAPAANNIPVIQLESRVSQINDAIEYNIAERLQENFGVLVSGVDIGAIEIDKTSEGYRQLMSVTKDVTQQTVQAQKEANIKNIYDKQRIEAHDYEETLRVRREEGQYAAHKQTQSANFGAYQVEKQAEVGVEAARALGHMGENGAGSVSMGNGGGMGFNPAAMMASMSLGGVIGQKMADTMNSAMSGVNPNAQPAAVPPPIPTISYYVAINGQAQGAFSIEVLKQMQQNGQLTKETLVWKQGMANWEKASNVVDLQGFFVDLPPIPNS